MRAWQFSKPKTPGFGISKGYYLSVLASTAALPSIREIANPQGSDGAAVGFGVPLRDEDKSSIERPMERGLYAIAAKDQKTVLRLTVISRDEAGFDPEAFARSSAAVGVSDELLNRMRATWSLCQLTFESHDPMVAPALDLLLSVATRLSTLTDGVVGDAICQRYLLPEQVFSQRRSEYKLPIYAEEHVNANGMVRKDGLRAFTLGLQKFALPEMEILNLFEEDQRYASICLMWLTQQILTGIKVGEGYQVGAPNMPFEVREGGLDRSMWEGIPVFELLPPTKVDASEALKAWHAEIMRVG